MKYFIVILITLFPLFILGQHSITGKVISEEGKALSGATVVLLTKSDSIMSAFALTDELGRFRLDNIDKADYIIQVSYISYTSLSQEFETDWSSRNFDVGDLQLEESTAILQEVTIKAEHIPMGIRGDTISYNADAFKTKPNATVEDLLKKLPGIEVERNGNIKAQGQDVENVLVDGKEFFGGDPTMATKNLQAEAVDKVEVYDKQSEIAEFTGIDDGDEEKTINLQLKEDHKNGGFGNADVTGGTENSYDGKLNYFRFSPTLQASIILSANNINEETFTINDRIDFMGGIANAMSSGGLNIARYEGLEDGLNESASAGVNLNYDFSSKLTLRSHYLYNRINNELNQLSRTESITDNFRYETIDSLLSNKTNNNHQINTKFNYKLNPFTEFVFQNNLNFKMDNYNSNSFSNYLKEDSDLGFSTSDFNSTGESWGLDSRTIFKRKFKKKGRSIIASFTVKKDTDEKNELVNNMNRVEGNIMDIFQNQTYNNELTQLSYDLNITEPLSSKYFVGVNYNYGRSKENPERLFYDIENSSESLNEDLSTAYQKLYTFQRTGLSLRRNAKKLKMMLGLQAQFTELDGTINDNENSISGSYRNLLPSYTLEYDIRGGKSINFDYNTSVIAPELDQLMPLPDNTSPNFKYIGNPNLSPQYDHNLGLNFHLFDNFNFTSLFANVNVTLSKDRIVYRTDIDDNLFQTVEPVNTDKYRDLSAYMSFSKPFNPLKLKYKIRARARSANYDSFINNLSSNVVDNNMNLKFSLSNRKTDHVFVEAGIAYDYSSREYGIDPDFNQSYQNIQYFLATELYLKKGWTLASELDYTTYSESSFNDAPSFYIWNATVSKLYLDNKLEIRLSAFDLLNQNIGYRRTGDSQSIQEREYQTLGQFFSLGVHYKIGQGKEESGVRIEID